MSQDDEQHDREPWERLPPHLDPRFRRFRHPAMKSYGREYVLQNPGRFGIDLEAWAVAHPDPSDSEPPDRKD